MVLHRMTSQDDAVATKTNKNNQKKTKAEEAPKAEEVAVAEAPKAEETPAAETEAPKTEEEAPAAE